MSEEQDSDKEQQRTASGRFVKGAKSPNPAGRPRGRPSGARSQALVLAESMMCDEAHAIMRKALDLALAPDPDIRTLRMLVQLLVPQVKSRPIDFKLPKLDGVESVQASLRAVSVALAAGEITPLEAQALASMIDCYRDALMATDYEARLHEIEARLKQTGKL